MIHFHKQTSAQNKSALLYILQLKNNKIRTTGRSLAYETDAADQKMVVFKLLPGKKNLKCARKLYN